MNPITYLKTAIEEYRALVVESVEEGEGTESWGEKLVIRFDYKNPEEPFFLAKEGSRDSKYSNQAINGDDAPYGAGSKVEKIKKKKAKKWINDKDLSEEKYKKALKVHQMHMELRN